MELILDDSVASWDVELILDESARLGGIDTEPLAVPTARTIIE